MKLRPYQTDLIDRVRKSMQDGNRRVLLQLPTGGGKCLGFGTPVLMFDGTIKSVQDVQVGDLLMGDDSTPRTVLSLARGQEEMYRIKPTKGDAWEVNESHILSLVSNDKRGSHYNQVIDVELRDYLQFSNHKKHTLKQFSVGVEWPEVGLPLDPYFFGLWLGDGNSRNTAITSMDDAVVNEVYQQAELFGLSVRVVDLPGNKASEYHITSGARRNNPILRVLQGLNVINNKHIPREYLVNSRENRLALFAGIVDTDGYVQNNSLEIAQKSHALADDIVFLARSLGLRARASDKVVNGVTYKRINISGDMSELPTRVARRKFTKRNNAWKDATRTGFDVEPIGVGDYYGFEIDGNRRFLLGDFTVTHNTLVASEILKQTSDNGFTSIFLADRRKLIDQTGEKLGGYGVDHGIIMAGRESDFNAPVQVASIQTLYSRAIKREVMELPHVQLVVIDEAHKSLGSQYSELIHEHYPDAFVLGLTATPVRTDGRGLSEMYDDLVLGPSVDTLVDDDFLVPMRYYAPSKPDMNYLQSIIDKRKGDYNEAKLGKYMEQNDVLIGDVVEHYKRLAWDRQAVVFASSVRHSMYLAEAFNKAGIPAEHIDGQTFHHERQRIYEDVHSGKTQVLTNCAVLIEGWDEPQISAAILARPTKSVATYLQMAGRVLRPFPGKKDAILIDHSGAVQELGFVHEDRPWSLDASETIDEREDRLSAQQDKEEENERITCENCGTVYEGRRRCPECGWEPPKKKPKPVDVLQGELEEILAVERKKEEKLDWFERALGFERTKRMEKGWAKRAYRLKFKEEPPQPRKVGIPDKEIENWNTHMLIKERYSRSPKRRIKNG